MTSHSETARQWVHMLTGCCAFLLRVLTWWQAASIAAASLAFNLFVLPHIGGRRMYRPIDEARGFPLGIVLYPVAVLLLILAFSSRLDIAASAWGVLAFGDGAATLVGRRVGGRQWPWNLEKTIAGTIAFALCGGIGAVALEAWMRPVVVPAPSWWFVVVAPIAAAIAAALVETIPIRLDDNVSVPATAAAVLWLASQASLPVGAASGPVVLARLPWALGVNAGVSLAGYAAGTVSRSGTAVGALVGVIIYAAAGFEGWLFLFAAFAVATIASRLGRERKVLLGIAEEREGRRGAGNALANCGVAAIAAVAAVTTPHGAAALLAFVASLAAGGSDTVASEIGKAWGRSTFLVTTLSRVKPGTPGAMSLEGTSAGIVAAFALAALGVALGLVPRTAILAVVIGATAGALIESVLAATLEGPGVLNNDVLNFINTAIAAAVALAIA